MTIEPTRRALLSRVSLVLAGGALTSLVSACSSTVPAAPTAVAIAPATPAAAAAAAPPLAAANTATPATANRARATGGTLRVLMWQGPTILNPHFAQGTKDYTAARFCCEPLLTVSGDGTFIPVLAAEVPSRDNGGLSADGKTVTYKLRPGVKWADGEAFTADDVVFTYQYVINKETAAVTAGSYTDLETVEAARVTW